MTQLILHSIENGILTITLNRPEKLNSFNRAMSLELLNALELARSAVNTRVVILKAAGRAFCAGQDLSDVMPGKDGKALDLGAIVKECYNPVIKLIRETEKPIIAAVNGVAAGAGANLAFACDFIIATYDSHFIQSFSNVGLIPDSGGTFILPRLFGLARATAMTMLGDKLQAKDAYDLGAIYALAESATLHDQALTLAKRLAVMPTRGLGLTKQAFNSAYCNNLEQQLALEEKLQREAGYTADYAEGVKAFIQKRKPNFTGK